MYKTRTITVGALIMLMVTLLTGVSLIGTLQAETTLATEWNQSALSGNLTGGAKSMTNLTPLFFAIVLVAVGAVAVYEVFRGD